MQNTQKTDIQLKMEKIKQDIKNHKKNIAQLEQELQADEANGVALVLQAATDGIQVASGIIQAIDLIHTMAKSKKGEEEDGIKKEEEEKEAEPETRSLTEIVESINTMAATGNGSNSDVQAARTACTSAMTGTATQKLGELVEKFEKEKIELDIKKNLETLNVL
ncbi:MAG: hypothetical protein Q7S59_06915 [Sulfurimonas sp.]|nr:hypothetical protein [Sulfurimonas sp.]